MRQFTRSLIFHVRSLSETHWACKVLAQYQCCSCSRSCNLTQVFTYLLSSSSTFCSLLETPYLPTFLIQFRRYYRSNHHTRYQAQSRTTSRQHYPKYGHCSVPQHVSSGLSYCSKQRVSLSTWAGNRTLQSGIPPPP